jgi:hypothetical protein
MKRFKIGEPVIALTNPPDATHQPRVKGQQYIVQAIDYCAKCGSQSINIGYKAILCNSICPCGHRQPNGGLRFSDSKHFSRPQELELEIENAIEVEDYELAHELTNILNK